MMPSVLFAVACFSAASAAALWVAAKTFPNTEPKVCSSLWRTTVSTCSCIWGFRPPAPFAASCVLCAIAPLTWPRGKYSPAKPPASCHQPGKLNRCIHCGFPSPQALMPKYGLPSPQALTLHHCFPSPHALKEKCSGSASPPGGLTRKYRDCRWATEVAASCVCRHSKVQLQTKSAIIR